MIWQGKALGALIGIFAAGPVGALFGAFIGHLFDLHAQEGLRDAQAARVNSADVQELFFRATFQTMGHLAKADGHVSADEIRAARAMMIELQLGEREVRFAMELFSAGKAADFPLEGALRTLWHACSSRPDLCRMFVQIQLQAALWGGSLNPAGRRVLTRVCDVLGVSTYELVQMEALLRMQQASRQSSWHASAPPPQVDKVAQAYEVLGVNRDAADSEVIKAYRRLMNQNHPDKLHAKGLPESMMKVAEEKTRQIRAAYEVLRDVRGIR